MPNIDYVYIDQPYPLRLDTNNSLIGATDTDILYRKPDGTTETLTGSVSGTFIVATVTGAINDTAGIWNFQTTAIFSGDATATLGDLYIIRVKNLWDK